MSDNINIPAIHDDDLLKLLEKHGLIDKINKEEIHCVYCNEIISFDNLYGIFWKNNLPNFVCDSSECITKAAEENG